MGYKLVIAEKPSVAQSIAKVIGADRKCDGYLEGNGYLVSWCLGHLVGLADPQTYDAKYGKWRKEDLPILPEPFRYEVIRESGKQFRKLKELMIREDVESLVEATDAGREGELIFRLVYQQAGCRKPFERLWISSMEDKAIEEGFRNLKPSAEYDALYEAAVCREHADWIVGINATRLFSVLYGQTLNVGRVMTPTLALIADREKEIREFHPEPFYTLQMDVMGVNAASQRINDRSEAEKLLSEVRDTGIAEIKKLEKVRKSERPPLLYDLTSLQRDANRLYGFTAQQTLDYAQSLYEKKLLTYPRTDSRYLTDEMDESTKRLACLLKDKWKYTGILQLHTENVLNSSKVSDHHAIIPTENVYDLVPGKIPQGEQKILQLVTARLLSSIGEPCETEEYRLVLGCAGEEFTASSNVIAKPGWREIEDWVLGRNTGHGEKKSGSNDRDSSDADDDSDTEDENTQNAGMSLADLLKANSSALSEGNELPIGNSAIRQGMTVPKKRFTENTLLSAMERAGAAETPDEAERKGLGTPATRAGIIEKLIRIGFVERKGERKTKYLTPTDKGMALVSVMPEEIRSPLLTAQWEEKLLSVEKKELRSDEFMKEIEDMIRDLVRSSSVSQSAGLKMKPSFEPIGKCPACGSEIVEKPKGYFCSNRDCRFVLWKENRYFDSIGKKMTRQIAESLLRTGKAALKKCRSKKSGQTYDAVLNLTVNDRGQASFHLAFPDKAANGKGKATEDGGKISK